MTSRNLVKAAGVFAGLALTLPLISPQTPLAAQQAPAQGAPGAAAGGRGAGAPGGAARGGGGRGGGGAAADPRVQNRTYKMAEANNEEIPYCVFVSSKVSKDKKNPLIISLHGLGIGPDFMCRGKALDLAEEGGYILAAPMGYSTSGWYGANGPGGGGVGGARGAAPGGGRGGSGGGAGAPAGGPGRGAPAAPGNGFAAQAPQGRGGGGGRGGAPGGGTRGGGGGLGGGGNSPANLGELSEKDVLNILAMMRKEFSVDDSRTYLMGHSMGGAGTLFIGSKYAKEWAALAPIAPAAFSMQNDRAKYLKDIKDANLPVMFVHGDVDEMVPVANTRAWVETAKEMKMDFEYVEVPGASHGPIIEAGVPNIFKYFAAHTKSAKK